MPGKNRLYNSYVSTGQAAIDIAQKPSLKIEDYPNYRKIIKEHLPSNKYISIIDLACRHGVLVYCLIQSGYQNVRGVDISPEQVKLANYLGIREIECLEMSAFLILSKETYVEGSKAQDILSQNMLVIAMKCEE